jgi:two-component system phosphate regulon response regulator PhoB
LERRRACVLVADDDTDILELVTFYLRRAGHSVVIAHDGEEALQLVDERRPDAVILDIMMPRMTGYEVTKIMRENEETSDIPVILLSARAGGADMAHGFHLGADDYVRKPFSPAELGARLQAVLAPA